MLISRPDPPEGSAPTQLLKPPRQLYPLKICYHAD